LKAPGAYNGAGMQGYGTALKQAVRDEYGAHVYFALRGEMLPNEHSYMDIDDHVLDRWGIPVPRFHWRWSQHELKQVAHGLATMQSLVRLMGGDVPSLPLPEEAIKKGGEIIHEVGTTRMVTSRGAADRRANRPLARALGAHHTRPGERLSRLRSERGGANARSARAFDYLSDRDGPKRGPEGVHAANAARRAGHAAA
jgi:hypothetical protein